MVCIKTLRPISQLEWNVLFFLLFYNAYLNNQKILCLTSIYEFKRKLGFWTTLMTDWIFWEILFSKHWGWNLTNGIECWFPTSREPTLLLSLKEDILKYVKFSVFLWTRTKNKRSMTASEHPQLWVLHEYIQLNQFTDIVFTR